MVEQIKEGQDERINEETIDISKDREEKIAAKVEGVTYIEYDNNVGDNISL